MKPPIIAGIHPVGSCLARLYEQEVTALPRLLACPFASQGLKNAAIASQPANVEARKADLISAFTWELQRYGCISLPANPYYQPQIYSATARRVAA